MSAALERVIAEQQAVIDMLKKREDAHIQSCIQNVRNEKVFVDAVFTFMDNPKSHEARVNLRMILLGKGWCLTCENSPCECDE